MSWITPITNWIASNVLTSADMNRIEGNTQHLKDNKVDKVAGKSLSTEDYTTAEKTKLSGIETGATADQTASEIKTLYESNSNTNAYTDAEKTKLGGIETGAQVNTVTSVAGKTGAVAIEKADVGLSEVSNYGIATQAEAEAGTSNVKYMTPLRVKEALSASPALFNLDAANFVELTSSGTWTKPAGCKAVYVEMWGAGGGGGGGGRRSDGGESGQPGFGGTFVAHLFEGSMLPTHNSYTIGAGGTGGNYGTTYGNDGTNGGNTVFAEITARGGPGGAGAATTQNKMVATYFISNCGQEDCYSSTSNTVRAGACGGRVPTLYTTITAAGNSENGKAPQNNRSVGGGGGNGKRETTNGVPGGNGGHGALASGGGAGGGAYGTSTPAGNGGNGGKGVIRLWWW